MEQEYIKGDIVMYDNKIHTIMDTLGVNNYELSYISHPVNQLELSGVPLTPEILEKNGWGNFSDGFYLYRYSNEECVGIGLSSQTGYIWKALIGGRLLRSNINSVSDLQHFLYGLNIKHEMEV